ncbi:hypothetical protein [Coleofasciculus chthonoplastes]|uniref:hypothetical protein n=1 Tax=Coleofasciculus chthonoplastes TaxID=64178 RepID=UPI0032F6202A
MANSKNAIIEDYLNCRQRVLSELSSQELWNISNKSIELINGISQVLKSYDL